LKNKKKYRNVALSNSTYAILLKKGVKGESFDQIIARILKKDIEVEA
jgi:hypothetical protein